MINVQNMKHLITKLVKSVTVEENEDENMKFK